MNSNNLIMKFLKLKFAIGVITACLFLTLIEGTALAQAAYIAVSGPTTAQCPGTKLSYYISSSTVYPIGTGWEFSSAPPHYMDGTTRMDHAISIGLDYSGTLRVNTNIGWLLLDVTVQSGPYAVTASASPTSIFIGQSINLVSSGAASYTWAGEGLQSNGTATVTATPTSGGPKTYTVTGSSSSGSCSKSASAVVNVISAGPDRTLCNNVVVNLNDWGSSLTSGYWKLDGASTIYNSGNYMLNLASLSLGNHSMVYTNTTTGTSDEMVLTVIQQSIVSPLSFSPSSVCFNTNVNVSFDVNQMKGTLLKWEYSINSGASWSPVYNDPNNSNSGYWLQTTYGYASDGVTPYWFRITVQNGSCSPVTTDPSNYAKIIPGAIPANVAINVGGIISNCENITGQLSLNNFSGTIAEWRKGDSNNQNIYTSVANSNSSTINGINETHKVWYWPVFNINGCILTSATIMTSLEPSGPVGGTIGEGASFVRECNSASGSLNVNLSNGTLKWQRTIDITNESSWSTIADQTGSSLNISGYMYSSGTELLNTYFRVAADYNSCPTKYSGIFGVTVTTVAGTVSVNVPTACGQANGIVNSTGGVGTVVRWEYSQNNTDWLPIYNQDGTLYRGATYSYQTVNPSNFYRVARQLYGSDGISGCGEKTSNAAAVHVDAITNPSVLRFTGERQKATTDNDGQLTFYPEFQLQQPITGTIQDWLQFVGNDVNGIAVNPKNSSFNYSPNLTSTTGYKVLVKNASCNALYSGEAIFFVNNKSLGPAQTILNKTLDAYEGYSYQLKGDLSIQDGFSFGANSEQDFYVLLDDNYTIPPTDNNYVLEETIQHEGLTTELDVYFANAYQKQSNYAYLDGLGKSIQQVKRWGSPLEKDIVSYIGYDLLSRPSVNYLPYVSTTSDGMYKTGAAQDQYNFYKPGSDQVHDKIAMSTAAFATTYYERSPISRITEKSSPGEDWQQFAHTMRYENVMNSQYEVKLFKLSNDNLTLMLNGFYTPKKLNVSITYDEHGKSTMQYSDKQGQVVLKKVQLDTDNWNETYYVYDDFNLLRYVIQPEGVALLSGTPDESFLNTWAFQYRYDEQGRMIAKRVPGSDWTYMVYDARDRLVLTQDGNQRIGNKWSFTKYDLLNRAVMTGIFTWSDPANPGKIINQQEMTSKISTTSFEETYNSSYTSFYGYSNLVYPTTALEVLTVNYYDNYDFVTPLFGEGFSFIPSQVLVKGLATGQQIRVLGLETETWIRNVTYYNERYQPVKMFSKNYLGDIAVTDQVFDFAGRITSRTLTHKKGTTTIPITDRFDYDHSGRMLAHRHQVNGGQEIVLSQLAYNELGQLVDKSLHMHADATFAQSVDYRYNIRGWLSTINNAGLSHDQNLTNDDTNDLFGMELGYNYAGNTLADPQFNGNISEMVWATLGQSKHAYKLKYDPLNRLTDATYRDLGNEAMNDRFNEIISDYDRNGNIKTLQRTGQVIMGTYGQIDNLSYTYQGNQLTSVAEQGSNIPAGFNDQNTSGNDYTYDANGNMIIDKNKTISEIAYNYLNLPSKVSKTSGDYIKYLYDATGNKLSQQVYNSSNTLQKKTDYIDNFVYEDDVLQFINHEEGRVVLNRKDNLPELVTSFDGTTPSAFFLNAGIPGTLSSEQLSGETYLKFTNATFHWAGPLTNSVAVQAGETYKLRIQGYTTNSDVYVYIMGGDGSDVLWPGANFPLGASSESWMENTFTVPAGMDHVYLGVIFGDAHPNSEDAFYINSMALYKMTNLGTTTTNEYQYHLKDHLGNVRTTFTTKEEIEETIATLERGFENTERSEYVKYDDTRRVFDHLFDHTNGLKPSVIPGYSIRLNGSPEERNGIAKSFSVMPGDKIDMQVFGKYFDSSTPHTDQTAWDALLGFITQVHDAVQTVVIDGVGYTSGALRVPSYTGVLTDPEESALFPKAYLNWVIFDRDWKFVDGGAKQLQGGAEDGTDVAFGEISKSIDIKEPGYVYIWLSNTSIQMIDVYFDDFKVSHTKSPIVQQEEYYPFGLTFNSYSRESNVSNNFLYNQGTGEKTFKTERIYDLGLNVDESKFRTYDYTIGRWLQVDPKAEQGRQESWSPYQYSFNNPIRNNDPEGDICIPCVTAGVGFVVGATLNAVDQYQSGTLDGSWKSVSRILVAGAGGAIAGSGYGGVIAGAGVAAAAEAVDQKISTGQVNNITKVAAAGISSAVVGVALKGMTTLAVKSGLVNLTTAGAKALGKTTFVAGAKGVTAQGYTTSTGRAVEGAVVAVSKAAVEGTNGVASYAAGNFGTKVWPTLTSTSSAVSTPPLIKPAVSN